MTDYKLLTGGGVRRVATGATIPAVEGNTDWAAYQAWVAAGGTPLPADEPSIAAVRAAAILRLAAAADALRVAATGVRTPSEAYELERLEFYAGRASTDGTITAGEYPELEALIPERGATVSNVATAILADAVARRTAMAGILDVQSAGRAAINAAANSAAVQAALDAALENLEEL